MERLLSCEFNMDTACVERPGVKFCVSVFRQSQEWDWKAGQILA